MSEPRATFQFTRGSLHAKFLGLPLRAAIPLGGSLLGGALVGVGLGGGAGLLVGVVIVLCGVGISLLRLSSFTLSVLLGEGGRRLLRVSRSNRSLGHRAHRGGQDKGARSPARRSHAPLLQFHFGDVSFDGGSSVVVGRQVQSGFRLGSANPWLATGDERGDLAERWGRVLARMATELPNGVEIRWRVDVVPYLSELRDAAPSWAGMELSQGTWVTRPSLWAVQGAGAHARHSQSSRLRNSEADSLISAVLHELLPTGAYRLADDELVRTLQGPLYDQIGSWSGRTWRVPLTDFSPSWDEMRVGRYFATSLDLRQVPLRDVQGGFALPLFRPVAPMRSIFMRLSPMTSAKARQRTERRRTEAIANDRIRAEAGYLRKAAEEGERVALLRHEAELATGHALFEYDFETVLWANSRIELQNARIAFAKLAAESQLRFGPAYGRQLDVVFDLLGVSRR